MEKFFLKPLINASKKQLELANKIRDRAFANATDDQVRFYNRPPFNQAKFWLKNRGLEIIDIGVPRLQYSIDAINFKNTIYSADLVNSFNYWFEFAPRFKQAILLDKTHKDDDLVSQFLQIFKPWFTTITPAQYYTRR